MGLSGFDAPFGCCLLFIGLFESLEQSAAHSFVKFTASDADFCFFVLF